MFKFGLAVFKSAHIANIKHYTQTRRSGSVKVYTYSEHSTHHMS